MPGSVFRFNSMSLRGSLRLDVNQRVTRLAHVGYQPV
jgi:hypothetical protein